MKRVIAVSDSHGMLTALRQALIAAWEKGPVDAVVFLGDGISEWRTVSKEMSADHPRTLFFAVRGNNDWGSAVPEEQVFSMGGVTFYCCHGHQWHVKYDLNRLSFAAMEHGAQVALFGHTHCAFRSPENGCVFLNPGAVCDYSDRAPRYGEILIGEDGRISAHLERKN